MVCNNYKGIWVICSFSLMGKKNFVERCWHCYNRFISLNFTKESQRQTTYYYCTTSMLPKKVINLPFIQNASWVKSSQNESKMSQKWVGISTWRTGRFMFFRRRWRGMPTRTPTKCWGSSWCGGCDRSASGWNRPMLRLWDPMGTVHWHTSSCK